MSPRTRLSPCSRSVRAVRGERRDMVPASSARVTGLRKPFVARDRAILPLSIGLQLLLGLLFGHYYDMRIFMATGHLVGSGHNSYVAQDLTTVFGNSAFQG